MNAKFLSAKNCTPKPKSFGVCPTSFHPAPMSDILACHLARYFVKHFCQTFFACKFCFQNCYHCRMQISHQPPSLSSVAVVHAARRWPSECSAAPPCSARPGVLARASASWSSSPAAAAAAAAARAAEEDSLFCASFS